MGPWVDLCETFFKLFLYYYLQAARFGDASNNNKSGLESFNSPNKNAGGAGATSGKTSKKNSPSRK